MTNLIEVVVGNSYVSNKGNLIKIVAEYEKPGIPSNFRFVGITTDSENSEVFFFDKEGLCYEDRKDSLGYAWTLGDFIWIAVQEDGCIIVDFSLDRLKESWKAAGSKKIIFSQKIRPEAERLDFYFETNPSFGTATVTKR